MENPYNRAQLLKERIGLETRANGLANDWANDLARFDDDWIAAAAQHLLDGRPDLIDFVHAKRMVEVAAAQTLCRELLRRAETRELEAMECGP